LDVRRLRREDKWSWRRRRRSDSLLWKNWISIVDGIWIQRIPLSSASWRNLKRSNLRNHVLR